MKLQVNPPVTETKVVEVEPETITLTLSIAEAAALRALSGAGICKSNMDGLHLYYVDLRAVDRIRDLLGEILADLVAAGFRVNAAEPFTGDRR